MPERLYILTYRFYLPAGGCFKYADKPEYEDRMDIYKKTERDLFIAQYKQLKEQEKNELYISDLRCYVTRIIDDITDRMDDVINAI
jgi:hypothetical protein